MARADGSAWRRRGDMALRILAAVPLGYAVASLWAMAIARLLPGGRAEATVAASLMSFVICATAAMYAFAARSGARAFAVLVALGAVEANALPVAPSRAGCC